MGEAIVKGRKERERILRANEESIRPIPMPDLIQDNCKSRLLVCLFFGALFMNIMEVLYLVTQKKSVEAKTNPQKVLDSKYIPVYMLFKTIFYFVMLFILGCINSSRKPQYALTVIIFLCVPAFLYAMIWLDELFLVNLVECACWISITLLLLYNLVMGCSKKASKSYFMCIKNQVYYEYTFQKLFGRPSLQWAGRYFQKEWEVLQKKSASSKTFLDDNMGRLMSIYLRKYYLKSPK